MNRYHGLFLERLGGRHSSEGCVVVLVLMCAAALPVPVWSQTGIAKISG